MLNARDAYRLWAPSYAAETPVSFIDEKLARAMSPSVRNGALLDAGCGIGRRLAGSAAALAVGIDASPEMLAAGAAACVAAADVRALPFADHAFDLVWCRLVLGHLRDPAPAYRELARVCRPGGHVLVTDFHADAVARGYQRSFRDDAGQKHSVEHYVHDGRAHIAMAARAGLIAVRQRDGVIDDAVRDFYLRAGRGEAFARDRGLAVVAALLFRRPDSCG